MERQKPKRCRAVPHTPDRLGACGARLVAKALQGGQCVRRRPALRERGAKALLHSGPGAQTRLLARLQLDASEGGPDPSADDDRQIQKEQSEHRKEDRTYRHAAHTEGHENETVERSGLFDPRGELLFPEQTLLGECHVQQEQRGKQQQQRDRRFQ